ADRPDAEHGGRRLDRGKVAAGRGLGIKGNRNAGDSGGRLLEELQPLAAKAGMRIGESRDIALRSRDIANEATDLRILKAEKHDRNRSRLLLQGASARSGGDDDGIGGEAYQFDGVAHSSVEIVRAKAKIDPQIASVDPAEACELLPD